jgi:hypothetical protein
LDLAALYFQVPSELSAPNITMAVIAMPIDNFAAMLRIVSSFLSVTSPTLQSNSDTRIPRRCPLCADQDSHPDESFQFAVFPDLEARITKCQRFRWRSMDYNSQMI